MGGRAEAVREQARPYEVVGHLALTGQADRAVVLGREQLALVEPTGDLPSVVMLRHAVGMALAQLRQYEPALAELDRASVEAARSGQPALEAVVWANTAWTKARAGRPEEGLRDFTRAHEVLEREEPSQGTVVAAVNMAMSALQLGLLDVSGQWFDYAHAHVGVLPELSRRIAVTANRTLLDYEQGLQHEHAGRPGPARDRYEQSAATGRRGRELAAGMPAAAARPWVVNAAVNQGCCLAKLGRPEAALRELDAVADEVDTQTVLITRAAATMGRAWAELALGETTRSREHGEEAARLAESIGWGRWQADCHRALARAAERAGDPAGSAAHDARAADLLAQLGWQTRLRRLGVTLGLQAGGVGSVRHPQG